MSWCAFPWRGFLAPIAPWECESRPIVLSARRLGKPQTFMPHVSIKQRDLESNSLRLKSKRLRYGIEVQKLYLMRSIRIIPKYHHHLHYQQ